MSEELFIPTIADFERVLDENPEIRERIRRKLLTDEERELPRVVANLADQVNRLTIAVTQGFATAAADRATIRQEMNQGFAEAAADRADIRQGIAQGFADAAADRAAIRAEMAQGFAEAATDRATIRESLQNLEQSVHDIGEGQKRMGGLLLEQTAARRLFPRITQQMRLSRARVLKSLDRNLPDELTDTIYDAVDRGDITLDEANAVPLSDFIMDGYRGDDRQHTYVVTEVSATLNHHDIDRALARAAILEKATGDTVQPAVAAAVIPQPQREHAAEQKVLLYQIDSQW